MGVGAVILDGNCVLLVRRGNAPLKGEWSVPGGAVELGESLRSALAREVLEETGIEVRVGPLIEVFERVERSAEDQVEYHYVILDYLCTVTGGHLAHGSDAEAAQWAALDDLARYRLTTKASAVIGKGVDLREAAAAGSSPPSTYRSG